jgi:hypothetical protein
MGRTVYIPIANSILCLFIIAFSLSVFITNNTGVYAVRARGESMLPTVSEDALLILSKRAPQVGDIIHVRSSQFNYAHRLVSLDANKVLTKGDNLDETEQASPADVAGVVIFHMSFGSFLLTVLVIICVEMALASFWAFRLLDEVWHRRPQSPL